MNLLEELRNYYGDLSSDIASVIMSSSKNLDDKKAQALYNQIVSEFPSKEGLPLDKEKLKKALYLRPKKKGAVWSHCRKCGAEYDYRFMFCPSCYKATKEKVNDYYCKSGPDFPEGVIRYNMTHTALEKGELVCLDCEKTEFSFCKHFGVSDYTCTRDDQEMCQCRTCCAKVKRADRNYWELVRLDTK